MNKLFVFDMDGTLLPRTTASLEIAKKTGTLEELRIHAKVTGRYIR